MKIRHLKYIIPGLVATALIITSCEQNDPVPDIAANNLKGMFVVCEGIYGQANGDISFYDPDTGVSLINLFES